MSATSTTSTRPVRYARLAWQEARPSVQVIFLLRFVTGAALVAAGGCPGPLPAAAGAVTWCCVVAAIYLHNGAADVVEDRGNGSARPIASGRLPAGTAETIARALAGAGVVTGLAAPPPVAVLALVMLGLGWCYSSGPHPMKRTVAGFLIVVVSGGSLTYLAGAAVGGGRITGELVFCGLAMSAWMGVAGSTKDLSDVGGDRQAGRRTLPVLLGPGRCRLLMAAAVLALGGASLTVGLAWLPRMLPMAAVLLLGSVLVVVLLVRLPADAARSRRRLPYRAFMVTQYCAHAVVLAEVAAHLAPV